jgi:hypothetical protein
MSSETASRFSYLILFLFILCIIKFPQFIKLLEKLIEMGARAGS